MKQLLRIIFMILIIIDAITKQVTLAKTNKTDKENAVTKVKISKRDKFGDTLIALLVNINLLMVLFVILCICKIYDFIQLFYNSFKNLWRYFVFWFFRVILRTRILELSARIQVSEMECVYTAQKQEEIQNNLPPDNEDYV